TKQYLSQLETVDRSRARRWSESNGALQCRSDRLAGSRQRVPGGLCAFALARCWAKTEGTRDGEASRALDTADRLAPVVIRNDPIARDPVQTPRHRAQRQVWELDSLLNRFGIRGQGQQGADNQRDLDCGLAGWMQP